MSTINHHNADYSAGLPLAVGDRYYGQDIVRDFWFNYSNPSNIIGAMNSIPLIISGGICTQGSGNNLNITACSGLVNYAVVVMDSFALTPPTYKTVYTPVMVQSAQQTDLAIPSAILDGMTINYIKLKYSETDGATRSKAKKAGSYAYERIPSFSFVINTIAPTGNNDEILLNTFTGSGGVLTFTNIRSTPYKSSGSGSTIEILDIKSMSEKSGNPYPISNNISITESMIELNPLTLTVSRPYTAGQTSIYCDINHVVLDAMDATTGWTDNSNTTPATEGTIKVEGTNSLKTSISAVNGVMYAGKTFGTFSISSQNFRVRFYIATLTNVTAVTIRLSDGTNWNRYDFLSGITAGAWNTIEITNALASTANSGTLNKGSITGVRIGVTTNSSTTTNIYWDELTLSDSQDICVPTIISIYDSTNLELMKISAKVNTGSINTDQYTIVALSNSYATSVLAKMKMLSITQGINQGLAKHDSTLLGAALKTQYLINRKLLDNVSGKDIYLDAYWFDECIPVYDFPGTTSLRVTGDYSSQFKNLDNVILVQLKNVEGKTYQKYNTVFLKTYKILTLSADSTYSTYTTLTHTGASNSHGADNADWYIIRLSCDMLYFLGADSAQDTLTVSQPTDVQIQSQLLLFKDSFDRADGAVGNNWSVVTVSNNSGAAWAISSNTLYTYSGYGTVSFVQRSLENYTTAKLPLEVLFTVHNWRVASSAAGSAFDLIIGTDGTNPSAAGGNYNPSQGIHIRFDGGLGVGWNNVEIWQGNTRLTQTAGLMVDNGTGGTGALTPTYYWRVQVSRTVVKVKIWDASTAEPFAWSVITSITYPNNGNYMGFWASVGAITQTGFTVVDNFSIRSIYSGVITKSIIQNQSGSRLDSAIRLTRNDTTNQIPEAYYNNAILI